MRRQNIDDLPERIRHVFDQNARMQYALDHGIEHGDMRLVSQEAVI
jgi:cation transport regulator ChaB